MALDRAVLITGASGHIGFRTLVFLLEHGYQPKIVLRSLSKVDEIRNNAAIKSLNIDANALTFIEVPDMTIPGCFDTAVKDVRYICHIASPIASNADRNDTDFEKTIIKPAVLGTNYLLEAAAKSSTVRRIVITSSVIGFVPWQNMTSVESQTMFGAKSRLPTPEHPPDNLFAAYGQAKVTALNAAEAWIQAYKPHFDLIHVHPSYVLGRNNLLTSFDDATRGTNKVVLSIVLGDKTPGAKSAGGCVHVDDVARMHVQSLDTEKVPGNRSFVANLECVWQDVTGIVAKNFAKEVEERLVPNDGIKGTIPMHIDARETEEIFGFKFMSFEEQVKSIVGHYLELKKQAMAQKQ